MIDWRRVKPGWYLLAALFVYALVVSAALSRSNAALRELRMAGGVEAAADLASEPTGAVAADATPASAAAGGGLWFPIPGVSLPQEPAYLPGAPRAYRRGTNQGFDFYGGDAGIPIPYGAPVVAAAAGTVTRADLDYQEIDADAWQALLTDVQADGADDDQLDRLRGRQLWLRLDDGRTLRYGHLSGIRPGIAVGQRVYRGQVLGYVGNSGTDDGVAGSESGARLHFEVWQDGAFFGEGLELDEVRIEATSLFTGP